MRRHLFDDEHHLFRESAATFVAREIIPIQEQARSSRAIPRELWLTAGAQGLLGLSVPARYGGSGVSDFRFNAILQEELAKAGMAYASSIGIHGDTVAPYLVDLATEQQRDVWLPRFVSGDLVTAIAMTEPQAGSDLGAIRTTARPVGADWVINGSKTFITNGLSADLVVVAARTGSGGASTSITLFAALADTPGFVRGRKLDKVGQPEADTSELFFEDVVVAGENVIGEPGRGFVHMMERLPQERLSAGFSERRPYADGARRNTCLREGAAGVWQVDRLVPAQPLCARRTGHRARGHPGLRRQVPRGTGRRGTLAGRRRQGQMVVG